MVIGGGALIGGVRPSRPLGGVPRSVGRPSSSWHCPRRVCLVAAVQIFVLNLTTSVFVFVALRVAHYAFSAIDSICSRIDQRRALSVPVVARNSHTHFTQ